MAFASATDAEYAYAITITPPEGWYASCAEVRVEITGGAYENAAYQRPGEKSWTAMTGDCAVVEITANGVFRVRLDDPAGETHTEEAEINCLDMTAPLVTAGIRDKVLHAEASDGQSGVYGIMVDDRLYTTLQNGGLDLRLEDYAEAGASLKVLAVDNVGNRSAVTTIDNPYYAKPTPTPAPTATPTATPAPSPERYETVIIYTAVPEGSATPTPLPAAFAQSAPAASYNNTTPAAISNTPAPVVVQAVAATPVPTATPQISVELFDVTDDVIDVRDEAIAVPTDTPEPTIDPGTGFTNNGNAVTRDLLYDEHTNKQFITVETRNGNTFYLVIDYDKLSDEEGETYETYFLNPVDEADLLALLDDDALSALTSSEAAEAQIDYAEIESMIAAMTTPEPTAAPEPTPEPAETERRGANSAGILVVLLVLGAIGGGVYYFLTHKNSKTGTSGSADLDDYDFGLDDELDDIPEVREEGHDRDG